MIRARIRVAYSPELFDKTTRPTVTESLSFGARNGPTVMGVQCRPAFGSPSPRNTCSDSKCAKISKGGKGSNDHDPNPPHEGNRRQSRVPAKTATESPHRRKPPVPWPQHLSKPGIESKRLGLEPSSPVVTEQAVPASVRTTGMDSRVDVSLRESSSRSRAESCSSPERAAPFRRQTSSEM